MHGETVKFVKL